jgi:ATP-dependent Lhr-like helicase
MLGYNLCQRIMRVHIEETRYPYVSESAYQAIQSQRDDLGELLQRHGPAVQLDGGLARWWTFAGGRVNHTLKYGLEILEGWKVVADNFLVRIEGNGINHDSVRAAIQKLSDTTWWSDSQNAHTVLSRLPEYRLSKFQPCLPEKYALEVVGVYLLDIPGTVAWLAGVEP